MARCWARAVWVKNFPQAQMTWSWGSRYINWIIIKYKNDTGVYRANSNDLNLNSSCQFYKYKKWLKKTLTTKQRKFTRRTPFPSTTPARKAVVPKNKENRKVVTGMPLSHVPSQDVVRRYDQIEYTRIRSNICLIQNDKAYVKGLHNCWPR
jgi:hypothetical protein